MIKFNKVFFSKCIIMGVLISVLPSTYGLSSDSEDELVFDEWSMGTKVKKLNAQKKLTSSDSDKSVSDKRKKKLKRKKPKAEKTTTSDSDELVFDDWSKGISIKESEILRKHRQQPESQQPETQKKLKFSDQHKLPYYTMTLEGFQNHLKGKNLNQSQDGTVKHSNSK